MINKAAYDTLKSMQRANWQDQIRLPIKDPLTLLKQLDIPSGQIDLPVASLNSFPLKVPQPFLDRIKKGDPHDPLLRQVLPLAAEDVEQPGFTTDPVGELERRRATGILHKYYGRALMLTTGACAIHCRYCFRRHFPYNGGIAATGDWSEAMDYLTQDNSIREVILSGGDPLVMSDDKLSVLFDKLETIPHLQRLRIHTRLPVVIPNRITAELVSKLSGLRLKPIVVIHCNHANELDDTAVTALVQIREAGIVVLNQSVLLKGVNDQWEVIASLCERMFASGVLPYYLHMLDRVAGSAHFDVAMETATAIMEKLRIYLPGYLVPRLVREQSGAPYKIPVL